MESTIKARLARAKIALEGLSVGDSFGETFFVVPHLFPELLKERKLEVPPWEFTDDTNMALSIFSILRQFDKIEQSALAQSFAVRYDADRGYGPAMHGLLDLIRMGTDWCKAAAGLFVGMGSFGNGGAMRVAPLGAYFADDLERVVEQARLSAEITHAHSEGIEGAVAVALAAAWACRFREAGVRPEPAKFLECVLHYLDESLVKKGIKEALTIGKNNSINRVVDWLGNGSSTTAQDTVPFALWCAAQELDNYEEALWLTVSGEGDRDTTCAIVGGIVASYTGLETIPAKWLESREVLPDWPFVE